jgi:hypothetical protein
MLWTNAEDVPMTRTHSVVLTGVALLTLLGTVGLLLVVSYRSPEAGTISRSPSLSGARQDAHEAAVVASGLTTSRATALDPELPDDSHWVPKYPAGTHITLDESSWVPIGESASADARVDPPGMKVRIYFRHHKGHWYISEIGAPS